MSDSIQGVVTWLIVMAYCVPMAFITLASPIAGTILAAIITPLVFWLVAVKGKAAQ
jgi:hypothetical protein